MKNAVVRIFLKAKDYWQEKDLETFIGLIRSYRLDFLLEDIIDQLDLEEYSSVP